MKKEANDNFSNSEPRQVFDLNLGIFLSAYGVFTVCDLAAIFL